MDEELDDLVFADPIGQSNAQLPTQRLMRAKRRGDRYRDQAAGARVELLGAGPAVAEGVESRETTELASAVGFSGSERQLQRAAEQLAGQLEKSVVGVLSS